MYAINHAATALVIKKQQPRTPMIWLLLSVQLLEVLWVFFHYAGIERIYVQNGVINLGYLPFSHSVLTGAGLAILTWLIVAKGFKQPAVATALAIGVASHLVLDIIQHEADIQIAPFIAYPKLGLGLANIPLLDFAVETVYGVACWWYFNGNKALLAAILLFNISDIPLMLRTPLPSGVTVAQADFLVTTIIAIQIVLTWAAVWAFTRHEETPVTSPATA